MALDQVSGVPAGVLRVIGDGFFATIRAFSKRPLHHFPKAHSHRFTRESMGMIGCIIAEKGPL